jgi:hypothetical protein
LKKPGKYIILNPDNHVSNRQEKSGLYKELLLFIIIFAGIQNSYTQEKAEDTVHIISGRLIDYMNEDGIQFAHIINQTRGYAMISDTLGYFRILAGLNDLLNITAIGYYNLPVLMNDSIFFSERFRIFKMVPRMYSIKEVKVNPLGTYEQFKYDFLNLDIPEPEYQINPSIIADIESGIDTLDIIESFSVMSPITAIYNLVSKEGKSLRKLEKIMEEERFQEQIAHKYNHEMLMRITGMEGVELYEFITFCNFSREFLLEATEYEIIETILEKMKEFREVHNH